MTSLADTFEKLAKEATAGEWLAHDGERTVCKCCSVSGADHPIANVTRGEWGDEYPALRLVGESSLEQRAEPFIDRIVYGSVDEATACANAAFIAFCGTHRDTILSALRATEWKPISEAPKDGTEIDIWVSGPGARRIANCRWGVPARANWGDRHGNDIGLPPQWMTRDAVALDRRNGVATHFLPLPAPPAPEVES